jgi:hypothetical protein
MTNVDLVCVGHWRRHYQATYISLVLRISVPARAGDHCAIRACAAEAPLGRHDHYYRNMDLGWIKGLHLYKHARPHSLEEWLARFLLLFIILCLLLLVCRLWLFLPRVDMQGDKLVVKGSRMLLIDSRSLEAARYKFPAGQPTNLDPILCWCKNRCVDVRGT